MMNQYLNNRFAGDIRPIKKQRSENPAVLEKEFRFAVLKTQNGEYWTNVKIQIKPATLEYPTPSLFIGFNNGNGRCFAKATTADIAGIINFLTEIFPLVEDTLKTENDKANFVQQKLDEYTRIQAAANQIGMQTIPEENK